MEVCRNGRRALAETQGKDLAETQMSPLHSFQQVAQTALVREIVTEQG